MMDGGLWCVLELELLGVGEATSLHMATRWIPLSPSLRRPPFCQRRGGGRHRQGQAPPTPPHPTPCVCARVGGVCCACA